MDYRADVRIDGELVWSETYNDSHPNSVLKKVTNSIEDKEYVREESKEVEIDIVNKTGSFWIFIVKYRKKSGEWVRKLKNSVDKHFSKSELNDLFSRSNKTSVRGKLMEKQFKARNKILGEETDNPRESEKDDSGYKGNKKDKSNYKGNEKDDESGY